MSRVASVLQAALATCAVVAAYKALKLVEPEGWNVAPGAVMVCASAALLALPGWRGLDHGASLEALREAATKGVVLASVAAVVVALARSSQACWSHSTGRSAAVGLAAGILLLAALPLARSERLRAGKPILALAGVILLAALVAATGWWRGMTSGAIASLFVSRFVFTALGEELFFRGVLQARLNEAFGRPWTVLGARIGPGLVIVALLFGAVHLFNPARPYAGAWELDWASAIATALTGAWFGAVRELTGSIWPGALVHAVTDFLGGVLRA